VDFLERFYEFLRGPRGISLASRILPLIESNTFLFT